jgi:hypothetical protein
MNAVVELGDDVATRQLRARHHRIVTVALAARRFEIRVIGTRRGVLGALDVMQTMTIGAGRGYAIASFARDAWTVRYILTSFGWQFANDRLGLFG